MTLADMFIETYQINSSRCAEVAEQADATVSKTVEGKPHVGSSPTFGTF